MQPESTEISTSATSRNPSTPPPASHHGLPVNEHEPLRDQLERDRVGGSPSFVVADTTLASRSARLKNTDVPAINILPNEVLTHALSHCSPNDLSSVALVNRHFHGLVTTQYAWRAGFARYFPGADSVQSASSQAQDHFRTEKRTFTRLTALASWRSEYMIRTRLLRSLARGKPMRALAPPSSSRAGQSHVANATVLYNSQLLTTINALHVNFGVELNKRVSRVVHGADDVGTATSSDPLTGKVENWGLADPQVFFQFAERFPGDSLYGLGSGEVVGVPNAMDVSQAFGMVHGEGSPGGTIYYRTLEEQRGRFLQQSLPIIDRQLGAPQVNSRHETICSVWIAKSSSLPSLSDGLIGILTGSSAGIVSAYSLGSDGLRNARMARGELTARWVLSPGVPIIAIKVDESYSMSRRGQNRLWAVVLNALGEVFYLTQLPRRPTNTRTTKIEGLAEVERIAWTTGRSVYWSVVEPSRRLARPNPYQDSDIDGSYSPRSSWDGMCLTKDQIIAETLELETFIALKPKDVQARCLGWDMRRRLEVDFAGDDGLLAGEGVAVFECGLEEDTVATATRYVRCRYEDEPEVMLESVATIRPASVSLFGGTPDLPDGGEVQPVSVDQVLDREASPSPTQRRIDEEWRMSRFTFGGIKSVQITTTAIDGSSFATITQSEDPLLGANGLSGTSSPWASPALSTNRDVTAADIPGQRARLVGIGTSAGIVLLWDMRTSIPRSAGLVNTVDPCRIIYTDSPSISCLALTALYVVHGGNDGLVQAWDVLASNRAPIRTLNSRFSSRARRRLVQAEASPQGVGINLFAAGALALDPDPTSLRGIVSLGTHLKYWGFSSTAADQYKSHKRRLRRSERGSNNAGAPGAGFGRGNIKDYIANERLELEQERAARKREQNRLAGRFGTDMLGEDEALAYAAMLSTETLVQDEVRRRESGASSAAATPMLRGSVSSFTSRTPSPPAIDENLDADIAEAIRQSLDSQGSASPSSAIDPFISTAAYSTPPPNSYQYDIPIRQAKPRRTPRQSPRQSPQLGNAKSESSRAQEVSDLDFALQLSLAEEQSRREVIEADASEDFPVLKDESGGKGKRRAS